MSLSSSSLFRTLRWHPTYDGALLWLSAFSMFFVLGPSERMSNGAASHELYNSCLSDANGMDIDMKLTQHWATEDYEHGLKTSKPRCANAESATLNAGRSG